MTSPDTGSCANEREILMEMIFTLMSDFLEGKSKLNRMMKVIREEVKTSLSEHRDSLPPRVKSAFKEKVQELRLKKDEVTAVGKKLMHYCGKDKCHLIRIFLGNIETEWIHLENLIEFGCRKYQQSEHLTQRFIPNLLMNARESKGNGVSELVSNEGKGNDKLQRPDVDGMSKNKTNRSPREQEHNFSEIYESRGIRAQIIGKQRRLIIPIEDNTEFTSKYCSSVTVENAVQRGSPCRKAQTNLRQTKPLERISIVQCRGSRVMLIAIFLQPILLLLLYFMLILGPVCDGQHKKPFFDLSMVFDLTLRYANGRPPT